MNYIRWDRDLNPGSRCIGIVDFESTAFDHSAISPRRFRENYFGELGIRTLGPLARTHEFQSCALDHSANSPKNLSVSRYYWFEKILQLEIFFTSSVLCIGPLRRFFLLLPCNLSQDLYIARYCVIKKFCLCQSSSGVEQRPEKPCVGGSILPSGTIVMYFRGLAQMARAPGLGPGGREFESLVPEKTTMVHT